MNCSCEKVRDENKVVSVVAPYAGAGMCHSHNPPHLRSLVFALLPCSPSWVFHSVSTSTGRILICFYSRFHGKLGCVVPAGSWPHLLTFHIRSPPSLSILPSHFSSPPSFSIFIHHLRFPPSLFTFALESRSPSSLSCHHERT